MIVREYEEGFVMIRQHDHAVISGEMARNWKKDFLLTSRIRSEADWAVEVHDRAWIPLDQEPLWNEEQQRPYTFVDYPLEEKLQAYRNGIEATAKESLYAGILTSMHYQSFFENNQDDTRMKDFYEEQTRVQEDYLSRMKVEVPMELRQLHFDRLQFCDNLSLYICMNEPGASKEREIPWFKDGFPQRFDIAPGGIQSYWKNESSVILTPFPFAGEWTASVPYRFVTKARIGEIGLAEAYQEAEERDYFVTFD
ncbi:DUF3891 family protein [Salimicrobium halophilum]|uniref:DUF3891 domain-containing protein n=1 Tax=Salimicrobium halophilum TaxID=86666 RepID=A0A1G8UMY5_9BACI|nr:DUF3891 family protein [Salimicrobium halophilum]SDJ55198.1 Protein of unknown function [Salimicrobium halophilum]